MRKTALPLALLATALVCALPVAPAFATGSKRTFVSALGDDAHTATQCPLSTPCRTFAAAFSVTIADGEINVLDPASYGTLTITHGLSIQGHGWGSITAQSGEAITINAGATDKINLRGLLIDGAGTGDVGVFFTAGASLNIQDCVIRNFVSSGIDFEPTTTSNLSVSNTLVSDTGNGTGIFVGPHGSAAVIGVLDRVEVDNSHFAGIGVNGTSTSGAVKVTISDSVVANGARAGIDSTSVGGGTTEVMVRNSTIANNSLLGLNAAGANSTLRVTRSTITGNGTGFGLINSGTLVSLGDNTLEGNTTNGAATSTVGYH